jgi:hypothetical protein
MGKSPEASAGTAFMTVSANGALPPATGRKQSVGILVY